MTEYLQIKIDRNAYNVALKILHNALVFMRDLPYRHDECAQLERAVGAFHAGHLINKTTKTQHTHNKAMTEDEKDMLLANFERLIRQTAIMGGYKYEGDCGEYTLTPIGTCQCPQIEAVIYDLVNALGNLESIKTED
ncbi:MAG: hypothetical protein IJZ39_12320 [Oscillospiraceae bacterium]|nr:hypothetical protein [Oscillospiraceae bacterium]